MILVRFQFEAPITIVTVPAAAQDKVQDKVKVGVFPVSSSLPYFVALERGFFKEQNIEPETVRLIGGPPNVAAMITNQIDAAAVLVTIEGMNADLKKPGVAMYISLNSQNKTYQMEQFVARKGYAAETLKDLKGARIMSAPGPANVLAAKAGDQLRRRAGHGAGKPQLREGMCPSRRHGVLRRGVLRHESA